MKFLDKFKTEILLLGLLAILYFVLRMPSLTSQPIFADEAIYIRWAQVMRAEPTLRFLPLSDGKTPLFMWTMIPLFKIFSDPLFAGRFLSVLSGFFTLLGVYFLSRKVFGKTASLWAGFLYVITPFSVFYDRMALVDSMLSAFTVWIVYFAILLVEKVRLDLGMILGLLLGGAWLTKTPAFLNLFILPLSILGFKQTKADSTRFFKLFLFWTVALVIALGMYNSLRLGPNFHLLSSRNSDYIFTLKELKPRPLDPFIPHFRDLSDWFPKMITWPIMIVFALGLWNLVKGKNKLGWIVLGWAVIPMLVSMAFFKTYTGRYVLPSIPLFLIIAGYGMEEILNFKFSISKQILTLLIVLVIGFLPLRFDYELLTAPPPTDLTNEARRGYFESWTAGYGFSDIANFLINESKKGPVAVGTEGFFGTLPDGLYIYLDKANIAVIGSHASISAQLRQSASKNSTFFVGNKKSLEGVISGVKLIKEYPKVAPKDGSKQDATQLYQVLPNE